VVRVCVCDGREKDNARSVAHWCDCEQTQGAVRRAQRRSPQAPRRPAAPPGPNTVPIRREDRCVEAKALYHLKGERHPAHVLGLLLRRGHVLGHRRSVTQIVIDFVTPDLYSSLSSSRPATAPPHGDARTPYELHAPALEGRGHPYARFVFPPLTTHAPRFRR